MSGDAAHTCRTCSSSIKVHFTFGATATDGESAPLDKPRGLPARGPRNQRTSTTNVLSFLDGIDAQLDSLSQTPTRASATQEAIAGLKSGERRTASSSSGTPKRPRASSPAPSSSKRSRRSPSPVSSSSKRAPPPRKPKGGQTPARSGGGREAGQFKSQSNRGRGRPADQDNATGVSTIYFILAHSKEGERDALPDDQRRAPTKTQIMTAVSQGLAVRDTMFPVARFSELDNYGDIDHTLRLAHPVLFQFVDLFYPGAEIRLVLKDGTKLSLVPANLGLRGSEVLEQRHGTGTWKTRTSYFAIHVPCSADHFIEWQERGRPQDRNAPDYELYAPEDSITGFGVSEEFPPDEQWRAGLDFDKKGKGRQVVDAAQAQSDTETVPNDSPVNEPLSLPPPACSSGFRTSTPAMQPDAEEVERQRRQLRRHVDNATSSFASFSLAEPDTPAPSIDMPAAAPNIETFTMTGLSSTSDWNYDEFNWDDSTPFMPPDSIMTDATIPLAHPDLPVPSTSTTLSMTTTPTSNAPVSTTMSMSTATPAPTLPSIAPPITVPTSEFIDVDALPDPPHHMHDAAAVARQQRRTRLVLAAFKPTNKSPW
ncbi:hypothetical protein PENSPDRAFT_758390 [Peniophora sp. CONT]|nr:hypothetical protein PENSPDRAFT_758390 [Peniophora sp. CONT]